MLWSDKANLGNRRRGGWGGTVRHHGLGLCKILRLALVGEA